MLCNTQSGAAHSIQHTASSEWNEPNKPVQYHQTFAMNANVNFITNKSPTLLGWKLLRVCTVHVDFSRITFFSSLPQRSIQYFILIITSICIIRIRIHIYIRGCFLLSWINVYSKNTFSVGFPSKRRITVHLTFRRFKSDKKKALSVFGFCCNSQFFCACTHT